MKSYRDYVFMQIFTQLFVSGWDVQKKIMLYACVTNMDSLEVITVLHFSSFFSGFWFCINRTERLTLFSSTTDTG